ncbi:hypothetical protein [Altericista sp. CCNU0014]|uniref:hypothetical protein n=1 Tax=Altericista sp. CCNU0014 TaxID=3082949 RepID=UPI00384A77ED
MCGIAGILTAQSDFFHLERRIQWMQGALFHRGPDDRGIYISKDWDIALAHTRLAILQHWWQSIQP